MTWVVISWFFQDILQAFLSQSILVPEYFLPFLLYRVFSSEYDSKAFIWIAFGGGILWDLRWTGLPGMSSGIYVSIILLLNWIWSLLPETGRTTLVFVILMWSGSFLVYLSRIFVWDARGYSFYSGFIVQQLCIIPLLILMGVWRNWKAGQQND